MAPEESELLRRVGKQNVHDNKRSGESENVVERHLRAWVDSAWFQIWVAMAERVCQKLERIGIIRDDEEM